MNPPTATPPPDWLIFAIIGGFLVVFPVFWCCVVWMLSRMSGWHTLAKRHAAGSRPMEGTCVGGVTGMVGGVSYRSTLTLHFNPDGFFLEVMPLFKPGHQRLFIPWSEVTARVPFRVLWWKAEKLTIGEPVIGTITLPADLLARHAPRPSTY